MQDHSYSFVIDAAPAELWAATHPPRPPLGPGEVRVIEHGDVRIEILYEGGAHGDGLVRHCWFRVPRYLLSGGRAQSWEWVTPVDPERSSHYTAIGKPLWSTAEGWQTFEDLGDGQTKVTFRETYHVFNPIVRVLLEKRVHHFISKDNDRMVKAGLEQALAAYRKARAGSEVAPAAGAPAP